MSNKEPDAPSPPADKTEIDLKGLAVADRWFAATAASVVAQPPFVEMLFRQELPGGGDCLAALVVRIPANRLKDALYAGGVPFPTRVAKYLEAQGIEIPALEAPDYGRLPTGRTAIEYASMVQIGHTDHEAEFLFFRISPWEIRMRGSVSEAVYPIIRVSTSSALLLAVLGALRDLIRPGSPEGSG